MKRDGAADGWPSHAGPDSEFDAEPSRVPVHDGPENRNVPNADAGDSTPMCMNCGDEVDDVHTWKDCAEGLAKKRLSLVDSLVDAERENVTLRKVADAARALASTMADSWLYEMTWTNGDGDLTVYSDGWACTGCLDDKGGSPPSVETREAIVHRPECTLGNVLAALRELDEETR